MNIFSIGIQKQTWNFGQFKLWGPDWPCWAGKFIQNYVTEISTYILKKKPWIEPALAQVFYLGTKTLAECKTFLSSRHNWIWLLVAITLTITFSFLTFFFPVSKVCIPLYGKRQKRKCKRGRGFFFYDSVNGWRHSARVSHTVLKLPVPQWPFCYKLSNIYGFSTFKIHLYWFQLKLHMFVSFLQPTFSVQGLSASA